MASSFADAIMSNMIASMDPTIHMQRDAMQGFLAQQQLSLKVQAGNTVAEIGKLLQNAIQDKHDPKIIEVYKELLEKVSSTI